MTGPKPDDTQLDALAAQARAHPPLTEGEVNRLLAEARATPNSTATASLVEHLLGSALDVALRHAGKAVPAGMELADLYQEAALATHTAVSTYVRTQGDAAGLRPFVDEAMTGHLAKEIARAGQLHEADQALARDASLLSAVRVHLRKELKRQATDPELAAALKWPQERVEVVAAVLDTAQLQHDAELLEYLDDADEPEELD